MVGIIGGILAVLLIVGHEWRAHRKWRRSINDSKCRAIGRKLEQTPPDRTRRVPGEYDDLQWARIRRIVQSAPLRDSGRPLVHYSTRHFGG